MSSVSFSICSFIYIIIFSIVYFSKTRINLVENKIYTLLLITTIVGLSIDIIGYFAFLDGVANSVKNLGIAKIYLIYYFTWIYLLTIYTYIISTKQKKKNFTNLFKNLLKLYIIIILIIPLLKTQIKMTNTSLYSFGPSVNLVYMLSGICVLIMLICILKNLQNIKSKKYIPLLVFIVFGSLVMIIQHEYPELLLLITCQSIVTALMYFTIENPDMQMVEELNKNKKLTEQNFEEKTNFLFKISQDLKQPLKQITDISTELIEQKEIDIEKLKKINNNSKQLYTYVNNALDVSNMDIKNLKIIESTYYAKNFFEEIKLRITTEIKNQNKNIEFRYNISDNIPEKLIGDNSKLKQVILSVIFDSIKHTKKGFIELNVNTIIKYGICRLMIEISDSGSGMSLEKINTILQATGDLTKEEIERIDKINITLPLAHKIIKTLNGSFIIKSEIDEGTNFLIIIDQKIEKKEKTQIEKKLENYEKKLSTNKKILLVSTDKKTVEKLTKLYEKNDIDVINSLYGKDVKNRLEQKENFEFILIDDELTNESGIDILKQIKDKTTKPMIILINKNEEFISKHYIEDGFNEYIIKENIEDEIKKLNKYL